MKEAKLNLGYTAIRSPVTGLASRALQREGTYINSMADTAKLTYVAALDPIWANFSVSQNQVTRLRDLIEKGQLTAPEGQTFEVELRERTL